MTNEIKQTKTDVPEVKVDVKTKKKETRQSKKQARTKANLETVTDKGKQTDQEQSEDKRAKRQLRREKRATHRIFPIWLRLIVVFVLIVLATILGLIIGYSVLGDGEPLDVLTFELWQRIIDIMTGK